MRGAFLDRHLEKLFLAAAMLALAGSLRWRGLSRAGILAALVAENEARCRPPKSQREIEGIVDWIMGKDATAPYASPSDKYQRRMRLHTPPVPSLAELGVEVTS